MAGGRPETRPEMAGDPPTNSGQAQGQQHQHQHQHQHQRHGGGGGGQAQNRGPPPRAGATTAYGHSSPASYGFDQSRLNKGPSSPSSPSHPPSPDRIGGRHYHHQPEYSYLEEEELPSRLRQPGYPPPHRQELLPQELLWQQHQRRGGNNNNNNNNNNTQHRGRRRRPRSDRPGQRRSSGSSPWFAAPGGGEGFEDYGYQYGSGGENHQPATTARQMLDEDFEGDLEATERMDRDSRSRR
ncbi:hypothetical protein DL764_010964 [Monosporascus ibericus]|uniref:Uncharacterized protein n=1 Tax=Monosporascus ibericus TaxID=155417 RepID=A0A4Q4SRT4_9PEZI|nr:hypothetical protein DL764_010964 [Monosporascus ibericus]